MDEWLTIAEAAERLKVDQRTLYRYMAAGKLPYYTIGGEGVRRLKRSDVDGLMVPGNKEAAQDNS